MWLCWRWSLRKWLRLNKFVRVEPLSSRNGVLVRRGRDIRSLSLPWEDIARRELPTSQEESFYQNPTMLAPWSWTPSLQNYKKVNLCFWSHPIYSILLWLPNLTHGANQKSAISWWSTCQNEQTSQISESESHSVVSDSVRPQGL